MDLGPRKCGARRARLTPRARSRGRMGSFPASRLLINGPDCGLTFPLCMRLHARPQILRMWIDIPEPRGPTHEVKGSLLMLHKQGLTAGRGSPVDIFCQEGMGWGRKKDIWSFHFPGSGAFLLGSCQSSKCHSPSTRLINLLCSQQSIFAQRVFARVRDCKCAPCVLRSTAA